MIDIEKMFAVNQASTEIYDALSEKQRGELAMFVSNWIREQGQPQKFIILDGPESGDKTFILEPRNIDSDYKHVWYTAHLGTTVK